MQRITFAILVSVFLFTVRADEVTITVNNKLDYAFSSAPRVFDVAQAINPSADWYWPAATLFSLESSSELEQIRLQLLSTLRKRLGYWEKEQEQAYIELLQGLINDIESMTFASHIAISIDPIGAGAKLELNPRFTGGKYLLNVPEERPSIVHVWGAVSSQQLDFIAAGAVADYRAVLQLDSVADNSYLFLLQADRKVQKVGTAYWNKQAIVPLPSAQIIVPFSRKLLRSDTKNVNAQLLILAQNRVL